MGLVCIEMAKGIESKSETLSLLCPYLRLCCYCSTIL